MTCASRSTPKTPSASSTGRQGRRRRDHARPSRPAASELIELAKLVAFSQNKPLRQVKFQYPNEDDKIGEGDYVTSTPELERATLARIPLWRTAGDPRASRDRAAPGPARDARGQLTGTGLPPAPASRSRAGAAPHAVAGALPGTPDRRRPNPQEVRAYRCSTSKAGRNAYVAVWQQNIIGGYYDVEGTDWLEPAAL